ncbi:ribonuclease E inhibitor RraB [Dongshaea marina]|uniref:ribonuclease E inhibitor RraB n=1 Tax=Dongshaea marina TaxID=2047966 RepID=UPI000D3EC3B5|nr:ribonuclease E inhibitor RraB [Dongshaea marina]
MSEQMEQWRDECEDIIEELLEDGSNPDALYTIEYHFAAKSEEPALQAAEQLFTAGFDVSEVELFETDEGEELYCFDIYGESELDSDSILEPLPKMLEIAAQYAIEYDGWGTYFEE